MNSSCHGMMGAKKMNVLVIDDQKKIVDTICEGLDWDELGVFHVHGACSAAEARKIIENEDIDIMVSDIEMPGESGLELYSWVRAQNFDIDCIFLTSHADFEYAKEAIHLGSVDYILQPARLEDIEAALKKHIGEREERLHLKELKKSKNVLKQKEYVLIDRTFERMLSEGFSSAEEQGFEIESLCHRTYHRECFYIFGIEITQWLHQEWGSQLMRLVLVNVLGELFENYECEILIGQIRKTDYVAMIHGNADTMSQEIIETQIEKMHLFMKEKMPFRIAVYLGGFIENGVHGRLEKIRMLIEDNVMRADGIHREKLKVSEDVFKKECLHTKRWGQLLEDGSWQVILEETETFFRLNRGILDLAAMKRLYLEYSRAFFEVVNKKKLNVGSFFSDQYTYDDFCDSYTGCEKFLEAVRYTGSQLEKRSDADSDRGRLEKTRQYINENISKNITRSEVASYLYLSEEYFSRWFSKETGMSFKNYVLEQKMEYAKQLLVSTRFTVGIIASKVGYDNFSHFSQMFKKHEGMTPQDYRTKMSQNR